jgi:phytol kinase
MSIILSVVAVFIVLIFSEYGWRKHWLTNEFGRKFVHITVGSFVAFWPFFMTWSQIRLLSLAFLVVVILSNQYKLFHAIHSVQRPTFGESCFAAVVGLLTLVTHSKGIYAAALLQMSLADGLAAVLGTRYGRDNKYHVYGHLKSVVGTSTFFIISLSLLVGYGLYSVVGISLGVAVAGALIATAVENLAPLGLDNLLVPLFIGILLTNL